MWEHITNSGPAIEFEDIPLGVIIPHHAITATVTARFYQGMAKKIQPQTVFILAPNHFESGETDIISTATVCYNTVYGRLETDMQFPGLLAASQLVSLDSRPFNSEHAIFFHAPFIKKFFPDSKIVPVIIKWDTPKEKLEELSRVLENIILPDALVLASVDFSHYNRRETADFHDRASFRTISNFDVDSLFSLEIDSPASVYVLEKIMAARGYRKGVRLFETNSEDFTKKREEESTSHQYFTFFKGEPEYKKGLTILLSGNINGKNDSLYLFDKWLWDRAYVPEKDYTIKRFLKNIRGQEDRFFMGTDLYIFDCEQEEKAYRFQKNSVIIQVIKFREGELSDADYSRVIKALSAGCDCLVVIYQYDSGKLAFPGQKTAEMFVDNGADIFLGRGIHEPKEPELYKDGLVIYSAGDFIEETGPAAGMIVYVDYTPKKLSCVKVPVRVRSGYPELDE